MTKKQICIVFVLLFFLFILIFSLNFYFLTRLNEQIITKDSQKRRTNKEIENRIRRAARILKPVYLNKNPRFYVIRNKLLRTFKPTTYDNASIIWDISRWWPNENEIYPESDTLIGQLLKALQSEAIISARNFPKGTQMKLLFTLAGGQKIIFKPKWYEKNVIIDGPVYSGKDRHISEIFGFYLGAALNMRWTPFAVGRKLNLKHVYSIADKDLRKTIFKNNNGNQTQYCVYGKCFYCKETESVCGDETNDIEGVLLKLIPGIFSKYRSPWQRTYKENQKAEWEDSTDYCESVKNKITQTRLLDLIDAAIFDFLIQNGDRHHYETRNDRIVLIDNGKGFGNPTVDYLDILAPLYQCCLLRKTTWERLLFYSGGTLTELIDNLSKFDQLYPILTEEHNKSVERRLLLIFSTVELCIEKFGSEIFK